MLHVIENYQALRALCGNVTDAELFARKVPGMLFCPECVERSKGNPS